MVATAAAPHRGVRIPAAPRIAAASPRLDLPPAPAPAPPVTAAAVVTQVVPPAPPRLRPVLAPPTDPEAPVPTRARDPD
jgi:hypothetical protein